MRVLVELLGMLGRPRGRRGTAAPLAILAAMALGWAAGCSREGSPSGDSIVPEWSALSATLLVLRGSAWRYRDDLVERGSRGGVELQPLHRMRRFMVRDNTIRIEGSADRA
jgi:hypothetical protein